MTDRLPSWRPGPTRDAIIEFLDAIDDVPIDERVAYIDNDGTLWCEKPTYVQLDFFVDALQRRVADDARLAERPEFDAVLSGDRAKLAEVGLPKVATAVASLFDGRTPDEFAAAVDEFIGRYRHRTTGAPIGGVVYQPMLELIDELRAHDVAVGVVTGGGTEFVRRVSHGLYGVEPGMVVGTMIGYQFGRDDDGRPELRRTMSMMSAPNEGGAKIAHIQANIGQRPLIAIGNSGGDREMLEWAQAHPRGGLAVLIDHDDAEREFAYASEAATFTDPEPIVDVGRRLGWTIVSMATDWSTVFATA
ncbi:haloacid dehalogenase-like hydrolase [Ilumatobacter fluminis]|uniref:Haloacid dehalogenase-like hydrolase n=1 Tax=Ilumatobacter fluminis TaxID=467091 RepID=A0A4R7I5K3_9ACTN|nr:haloacid dehalogenase-like hydrolase [Ilumatobacter fluminis]TDT17973.1 haloacid dehalogenase-like hydrolase [Ilumatobacter fluminis]